MFDALKMGELSWNEHAGFLSILETRVVSSNRTVGEKATDWQRHATQRERVDFTSGFWSQNDFIWDGWLKLATSYAATVRWLATQTAKLSNTKVSFFVSLLVQGIQHVPMAVMAGYKGGLTRYWICMSVSVNISNTSNNTSAQLSLVFGRVDQQWTHYSA
jgi:hypothetical protein